MKLNKINSEYTLLTINQAAKKLNIGQTSLYRIVRNDDTFPAIKISNKWVIIEEKLAIWIEKQLEKKSELL